MKGIKLGVLIALGSILSACMTYQVDAATYKWTDSNGQVNYTQTAPNNALVSTIITAPVISAEIPVLKNKVMMTAKQDTDMDIIEQYNCNEAKNLLHSLQEAGDKQVAVLDPQGNKKYLTAAEKSDYSAKAKNEVKKYCSDSY